MQNYFPQTLQNRKTVFLVLLIAALIPTYFIHTTDYPDWGDDFAQYVYQGQQIHSPSPVYKLVLNVEGYSSPKRSVFFSVVLSCIQPTLIIQNYVNVTAVFYIIAGLCVFLFLSRHFSLPVSVAGSLCLFYNFLFLRLKSEVVPEFLFISLFYFILHLFYSKKEWVKYLIPLLLGLLVSVRFVGLSLLIAYLVSLLISHEFQLRQKLKAISICLMLFGIVVLFINNFFISSINNQEVHLYGNIVREGFEGNTLIDNISNYAHTILYFFEQEIPFWINSILTFVVFICFVFGFFLSLKTRLNILHFTFVFYFVFLFFYPNKSDAIKYLIPVMPLVFYFMIYGAALILVKISTGYEQPFMLIGIVIVLLSNCKTIWLAIHHDDKRVGPYEAAVLEDFTKVKKIVGAYQSIASGKPFVINLLCDRHSYFLSEKNQGEVLNKADYLLAPKQNIEELYPKSKNIKVTTGDTVSLTHFYLVKL